MREISVTALYKNLSKELGDLPFKITSHGKTVAVMIAPESLEINTARDKSLENEVTFRPYSKAMQIGKAR